MITCTTPERIIPERTFRLYRFEESSDGRQEIGDIMGKKMYSVDCSYGWKDSLGGRDAEYAEVLKRGIDGYAYAEKHGIPLDTESQPYDNDTCGGRYIPYHEILRTSHLADYRGEWKGEGWYRIGYSDGGQDWTNDGPEWYEDRSTFFGSMEGAWGASTETHVPYADYLGDDDEPEEEE